VRLAKSILSYFLIGSLIVATMGITFSKHYCMGRLKDVAVFAHSKSCMPETEDCLPDCCQDVTEKWQLTDLENVKNDVTLKQVDYTFLINGFNPLFIAPLPLSINSSPGYLCEYKPTRDFTILYLSFLI
jgi:hypothetical protein